MIRILVVEDHGFIADLLKEVFKETADCRIAGRVRTADQVVPAAERLLPDLVLMNLCMPRTPSSLRVELCGLESMKELLAALPDTKVLVYSALPPYMQDAMNAGALGYLDKSCSVGELLAAIRSVASGGTAWPKLAAVK
jgi:DNA-binding NarL/FixJ family response regulator